ncbi:hypothetical protein ACFXHA_19675 [Nocardia sp. NPDC059240]|uniref:hypothetical protein n=1 Tax=Nocardia sp. NPDC059240 TaxID=3346786 RepID=UPI0036A32DF5
MRKSIVVAALIALPLLSACSNSQQAAPATTTPNAATTTAAAVTTVSGAPTVTPGASGTPSAGATTTPGSGSGLTADQISKALQDKGKLSQTTADCVANIYIQEGLSDSGIQKVIDSANGTNPTTAGLSKDDLIKAAKATTRIATECVK